jgi:hypothetical protein
MNNTGSMLMKACNAQAKNGLETSSKLFNAWLGNSGIIAILLNIKLHVLDRPTAYVNSIIRFAWNIYGERRTCLSVTNYTFNTTSYPCSTDR